MKPVPIKKWKKFLKNQGLEYKRTKGSHEIWDYPDDSLLRPITFRTNKKEIPPTHIRTCLSTLGISPDEFEDMISFL